MHTHECIMHPSPTIRMQRTKVTQEEQWAGFPRTLGYHRLISDDKAVSEKVENDEG